MACRATASPWRRTLSRWAWLVAPGAMLAGSALAAPHGGAPQPPMLPPPAMQRPMPPMPSLPPSVTPAHNAPNAQPPSATGRTPPAGPSNASPAHGVQSEGTPSRDAEGKSAGNPSAPPGSAAPSLPFHGGEARALRVEQLLQSYPQWVQRDPVGAPMLRDELTVLLPSEVALSAELQTQGFDLIRQSQVLGRRLLVLRPPSGLSLSQALEAVRRLMPGADVDFNHLLLGTGRADVAQQEGGTLSQPAAPERAAPLLIGLVDEAPRAAPELQGVRLEGKRCERPALQNTGHGTAVAVVLARSARAAGRPLVLHVADFGCGLGAVDTLAAALQNFVAARVPVVNVSAAGPYNRVMARLVELFLAQGHVLVAASGNEGPAAPPLYPAALPGVVAVTGVDERGRVLVEASRGPHVAFAAPGIVSVDGGDGLTKVWRGTSFAAPVVSGLLAARLPLPDREAAQAAISSLVRHAVDAGAPGRDPVYGYGLIGVGMAPATASN